MKTGTGKTEFSIKTHFGLYCENEWLAHVASSSVFIGWSVGSFIISWVADNYGRKLVIFPSFIVIICVGFLSVFSPNVQVFIVCKFIIGIFLSGNAHILYIMMAEFVDTDHRPLAVISISSSYSVWASLLCLQAYFIRDWKVLTIACTLPYFIVTAFFKFVPESIHWLHLHGFHEELEFVLKRISNWNRTTLPTDYKILKNNQFEKPKLNPLELFRTSMLRLLTNKLMYCWFTVTMCYFGLSLAADDLSGSTYRDFFILNAIEIPSNIISIYCCGRFGRKRTISRSMIVASLACIAVAFIPSTGKIKFIRLIFGVFGKACVTVVFNTFPSWTIELYGTDLRANAMGILNAASRMGGASSPWVAKALKHINPMAPFILMGCFGLIAGCVMFTLPETKGIVLRTISNSTDVKKGKDSEKNSQYEVTPMER